GFFSSIVRILSVVLAGFLLAGGCYGYYPVDKPSPAEGRRVLLSLSDSGTFLLAPKIGPFGTGIEGLLETSSDSAYTMSVLVIKRYETAEDWRGERVVVPRRLVTSMTERHFSPGRTVLFSAG